jgi:hypothetical protein
MSERNNFKDGKICLGSWFQRFQLMVGYLHCFWAAGKAGNHGRRAL